MAQHCLGENNRSGYASAVRFDRYLHSYFRSEKCLHTFIDATRLRVKQKNMFWIAITIIASNIETMTKQAAPSSIPLAYCDSRKESQSLEKPHFRSDSRNSSLKSRSGHLTTKKMPQIASETE